MILVFIAEEGPECFEEQKQPMIDCFNSTLRGYLDEPTPQASEGIPKLVMGKKQCELVFLFFNFSCFPIHSNVNFLLQSAIWIT